METLRLDQRRQHQAAEELVERGEIGGRQRQECAAVLKHAFGHQRVHVRIEIQRAAEGLDRRDHSGQGVAAKQPSA